MTYASAGGRKRAKDPVGHWPLAVGLAVEFVWVLIQVGSHAQDFAARDAAYVLGYMLAGTGTAALVVWAVVYSAFVRRAAPERALPYLLILFVFAMVLQGGFVAVVKAEAVQKAEIRTAEREVASSLSTLVHPKSGAPRIDTRPKASGDAGEAEHLVKVYMASLQDDQAAYKAEMTATDFARSLKPEHIANDRGLRATRANLAKAQTIVAKFRTLAQRRRADFRRSVSASTLSPAEKQSMLAGFDRAVSERDPDEIWKLESASLSEIDAAVVVLQKAQGRWAVRGNRLVFADPAVLAAYNQHVAALHQLARREAALRAEAVQKASAAFRGEDGGGQ